MRNAIIAAAVAAVVAATSSTAATLVITSKHIKNGTIQVADLSAAAKRALKGNRGARGLSGPAGVRGPQGIQGAQGAPGAPGAPGIQRVRFIVSPTTNIPANATQPGKADAVCPAGETAIAGGFSVSGAEAAVFQSVGTGNAWSTQAENSSPTAAASLTAYAYCSPGVTFVP